jgi:hypothetical protein
LQQRRGLVADHPAPVATTWSLSFQRVEDRNPAAAELLRLCAWYGKVGNVRGALEKMGITNSRYVRHASFLLGQRVNPNFKLAKSVYLSW